MLQLSVKENRSGIRHLPYLPSPMKSQPSRDHTATETKDWQHAMGLNDFYEFIKNVFWKLLYLWGKRQSVGQCYCYCYCAFALNYWNIFRALAGWHCFCSFVFEAGSLSAIARQLHLDTPNTTQYTQRINQDFIKIHNYDSGLKHFIFNLFFK